MRARKKKEKTTDSIDESETYDTIPKVLMKNL